MGNSANGEKPQKEEDFELMEGDATNEVITVKFHENEDYLADLLGGPWTVFVQYLMVQPWTLAFTTDQSLPNNLMVWIHLPGLPEEMYSKSLLKFIRNAIRPMAKIDHNTDVKSIGWFARLAVFVDLGKPLFSKVKIDERIQLVEYESLPIVCFGCGRYGHYREVCPHKAGQEANPLVEEDKSPKRAMVLQEVVEADKYV
ncbi:hypothetical protein PVK06_011943 [Gossypium arboreum]|uniref:CCHC-type domain-containing protein n=1 Tax=Gossypium arboreum TaxID=29729 RepID=A0ABR0QAA3_GOSAR|nr:hypothetical protein PVK06_011943 [Gossypium arboreum]